MVCPAGWARLGPTPCRYRQSTPRGACDTFGPTYLVPFGRRLDRASDPRSGRTVKTPCETGQPGGEAEFMWPHIALHAWCSGYDQWAAKVCPFTTTRFPSITAGQGTLSQPLQNTPPLPSGLGNRPFVRRPLSSPAWASIFTPEKETTKRELLSMKPPMYTFPYSSDGVSIWCFKSTLQYLSGLF